jgi:hypothetical protein
VDDGEDEGHPAAAEPVGQESADRVDEDDLPNKNEARGEFLKTLQGCQIFLRPSIPKREKYTK